MALRDQISSILATPSAIVRVEDSLVVLAQRIRNLNAFAEDSALTAINGYRDVGKALLLAKAKCGHGNWLSWLKDNLPFGERHAQRCMRLAKSDTSTDLESQWLIIIGQTPEIPEPEPVVAAAVPPSLAPVETEDDGPEPTPTESPAVLPFVPAGDPPDPPHKYTLLRNKVIALTKEMNEAIGADDRLRQALAAAALLDHGPDGVKFLPLVGVPILLTAAAQGGKLNEKSLKLDYQKACGTWLPPFVVMQRQKKAKPA